MEKGIFYLICTLVIVGAVAAFTVSTDKQLKTINDKLSLKPTPDVVVVTATPVPSATPTATLRFYRSISPTKVAK